MHLNTEKAHGHGTGSLHSCPFGMEAWGNALLFDFTEILSKDKCRYTIGKKFLMGQKFELWMSKYPCSCIKELGKGTRALGFGSLYLTLMLFA